MHSARIHHFGVLVKPCVCLQMRGEGAVALRVYVHPNTQVQGEVTEAVRRLAHHPSIVIWGGNNEVRLDCTDTRI
jgi:beta-galactosidase/beta-glucuronidase